MIFKRYILALYFLIPIIANAEEFNFIEDKASPEFLIACKKGQIDVMDAKIRDSQITQKQLVEKNKDRRTPFGVAFDASKFEAATYLLTKMTPKDSVHAIKNSMHHSGITQIFKWLMAYPTRIDLFKQLIQAGMPVDYISENRESLVFLSIKPEIRTGAKVDKTAIQRNHFLKYLIAAGAPINISSKAPGTEGMTPLIYAAKNRNLNAVQQLIQAKADVNIVDKKKRTAFHYACLNNDEAIISILKNAGTNIKLKDTNNRRWSSWFYMQRRLYKKIKKDKLIKIKPLLTPEEIEEKEELEDESNLDGERRDLESKNDVYLGNILAIAAYRGEVDSISKIAKKYKLNKLDPRWSTKNFMNRKAFQVAFDNQKYKLASSLHSHESKRGKKENLRWLKSKHRKTSIFLNTWLKEHIKAIELLVQAEVPIKTVTRTKQNLIHRAVLANNMEVLRYAIDKLNVKDKDKWGETPLHYAFRNKNKEMVNLLIDQDPSTLEVKSIVDVTPLDLAKIKERNRVTSYIEGKKSV